MKKILLILSIAFVCSLQVSATHLMGGQITARQLSGLTYEITFTAYRDTIGIPINTFANFRIQELSLAFDSTVVATHSGANPFLNGVEMYEYKDTITLPGTGSYVISWEDCCRNGAILNMANPLSESMYLMTEVYVDAAGTNSTPEFLNPPITLAQRMSLFQYNPLPFDADGDSLAWLLETPLSMGGNMVAGYTLPHADPLNPFTLNSQTGEITWMPDINGYWEASFRVEEYRSGIKIGEIRRDMQIIVVDDTTNWFHLVFNNGSWPQNGQGNYAMSLSPNVPFNLTLNVTDQDNDALSLDVQGEPMIQTINPAQWTILSNVPGSVTGSFSWTPSTAQARLMPYVLAFRGIEYHNMSAYPTDVTLSLNVNSLTGIKNVQQDFTAGKLFPNPTAGNWFLSFELKHSAEVTVDVFDLAGRKITSVLNQTMPAGNNLIENNKLKLSSGFYQVKVGVDGKTATSYPLVIQ